MLRRHRQVWKQIHQLLDVGLFVFGFWLAFVLRSDPDVVAFLHLDPNPQSFASYGRLYLILIPFSFFALEAQGFYNRPLLCSRRTTFWQLSKGCLLIVLSLILALFFFRLLIARWVVIWFGAISFLLVLTKEEVLRLAFKSRFSLAQYRRRIILVGAGGETGHLRAELKANSHEEVEILAELNLNETSVQRLVEMLHEYSVNGVILSARHSSFEQVEAIIRACELEGVEAWLITDFFKTQISHTSLDEFYGRPVLVFRSTPEASWQSVFKHVIDYIGAVVLLLVSALPFAAVALLIKLTSPGPVLFRQKRAGLNGQPFTMYKFRTMVSNAEQLKHELAALNEMSGPVFKMTNDPRVTPIGRWLRRTSLDEFPQLFNVLRGEMSLVGPRPLPVDEVQRLDDLAHRRRLSVKPGLTCLWQISGRNELSDFQEWVRLDLEYIDNWSLWLDLKILWRTVPIVLSGTGAR